MLKNSLLLLISVIFLSSCVTHKRCLEKFPPSIDSVKIIEHRDSIIYKDTIITVTIPGEKVTDSVFVNLPCPNIPDNYISDTLTLKTDFAISKSWVEKNKLKATLMQPDTTLRIRLDNALREAYYWESEYNKITEKPKPIKYIPKAYMAAFFILIGEIALVLAYFGFKIFK